MHAQDNYTESSHIAVTEGLAKAVFFLCCVVGGGFMIKALLIEVFMSSYGNGQTVVMQQPKLKRQRSIAAALEIWGRHSSYSQAMYGIERNRQPTAAYSLFAKTDLCFDTVLDLLLMGNSFNWVVGLKKMAAQVVQLQLQLGGTRTHDLLLSVCAELSLQQLYNQLQGGQTEALESRQPFSARREALLLSRQTLQPDKRLTYEQVSWLRGRSPTNSHLQRAILSLPKLLGFDMPTILPNMGQWLDTDGDVLVSKAEWIHSGGTLEYFQRWDFNDDGQLDRDELEAMVNKEHDEILMYEATLRLIRLLYLQKWALHRTYTHVNRMEEGNSRIRFQQLFRMCNAMDHMSESRPARVDSVRLAAEDLLDHADLDKFHTNRDVVNDASKMMQITRLMNRTVLLKQEQLDASNIFDLHSIPNHGADIMANMDVDDDDKVSKEEWAASGGTIEIFEKWDRDGDGHLDRDEVEAMVDSSKHARQLPFGSLKIALHQGLSKWTDGTDAQDQSVVDSVIAKFENQNQPMIEFDDFLEMRHDLKDMIVEQNVSTSHRVIFDLIREHAWLLEAGKPAERDFAVCGIGEVRLVFNLIAWATVLVLALFHSNDHVDIFDILLVVFAVLPWLEVYILGMHQGFENYITCKKTPSDHLAVWGSLVCLGVSLVGAFLLVSDASFVAPATARFLTSFSALLIFTKNPKFYDMFLALTGVVRIAWPIVGLLVAVVCLYALLAVCIFIVMLGLICVCGTA